MQVDEAEPETPESDWKREKVASCLEQEFSREVWKKHNPDTHLGQIQQDTCFSSWRDFFYLIFITFQWKSESCQYYVKNLQIYLKSINFFLNERKWRKFVLEKGIREAWLNVSRFLSRKTKSTITPLNQ